jgi:3-carboxy-cis,cis-muconate cycloisomerase
MLDVEAALADAEASNQVIPREAATAIGAAAKADFYDIDAIESEAERAGNLAIPLVRHLTSRVAATAPDVARYVHWGATSQDIIDTGLVLQLRASVPLIVGDLSRAADAAAMHAHQHAKTTMAGRTWLQQATPITFGLKAAGWCDALDRVTARLEAALGDALTLQFGGASGTLAALADRGPAIAASCGKALGLTVPPIPWHTHRDRLATLASALGVATGTAGKIGRDLGLLAQTEVDEAREPPSDAGGSSTMPHKRNPVGPVLARACALRVHALAAVFTGEHEHERAAGAWHAEWEPLCDLLSLTGAAASHVRGALEGLEVDAERMRANLRAEATSEGGADVAPEDYLGSASAFVDRALARRRRG